MRGVGSRRGSAEALDLTVRCSTARADVVRGSSRSARIFVPKFCPVILTEARTVACNRVHYEATGDGGVVYQPPTSVSPTGAGIFGASQRKL